MTCVLSKISNLKENSGEKNEPLVPSQPLPEFVFMIKSFISKKRLAYNASTGGIY